jgi:NADH-quinone oxidoreductase subunit N
MALAMAFFMLSLTGIPLTGGFAAKFYVLRAALEANLIWLALIGVITSVVSAFYYLRVVYLMYMYDGEAELIKNRALVTAVWITAIATLFLGILPAWGYDFARDAVLGSAQLLLAGG